MTGTPDQAAASTGRQRSAWTHFMQREYSWHRATGALTTQEGNASSREWLGRSRVRDKSCLACGESSTHLQQPHNTHKMTRRQETHAGRGLEIPKPGQNAAWGPNPLPLARLE